METEENIISSEAKLSAIAGVMFFPHFIKNKTKSDFSFTDKEKEFIMWYTQVWLVNLIVLIFVLFIIWINFFWNDWILNQITKVGSIAVFIISLFSIFACVNDLPMRWENDSIIQDIKHKWQILKVYAPIMNFFLRYRQENYNMPYRRLKESILLRSIFAFWTLFLWGNFWIWVLIVMFIRIILLLLNIDLIPISIKKAINSAFSCNPWELSAYIFTPLVSKLKKTDYDTVLQARKQSYSQWQSFWIWIIIQYLLLMTIFYFLHHWIDFSMGSIVLLFAIAVFIVKIILFYIHKKTFLKIPILSELVSLIFH